MTLTSLCGRLISQEKSPGPSSRTNVSGVCLDLSRMPVEEPTLYVTAARFTGLGQDASPNSSTRKPGVRTSCFPIGQVRAHHNRYVQQRRAGHNSPHLAESIFVLTTIILSTTLLPGMVEEVP